MSKPWRLTETIYDLSSWSSKSWFMVDDDEDPEPYKFIQKESPKEKHFTEMNVAISKTGQLVGGSKIYAPEKTLIVYMVKQAMDDIIYFIKMDFIKPDGTIVWKNYKNVASGYLFYEKKWEAFDLVRFFDTRAEEILKTADVLVSSQTLRKIVGLNY